MRLSIFANTHTHKCTLTHIHEQQLQVSEPERYRPPTAAHTRTHWHCAVHSGDAQRYSNV